MNEASVVTQLGDQVGTSMIVVWLIEQAKKAAWLPWITKHGGAVNRVLSVLLGSLAAAGIIWTFDPTAGRLIIDGLTLANGASVLWIILKQIAFQEGIYRGLVKPSVDVAAAKAVAAKDKAAVIGAVGQLKPDA